MNYEIVQLETKIIAGITARTGNQDPNCTAIIGGLWQRFMGDSVFQTIKDRVNDLAIGLYSSYDETSYDVTVGVEVSEADQNSFSVKTIPAGKYAVFFVRGDVVKDVANAWNEIWSMNLNRSFTADFEEYLNNDMQNAEIKIYIALKDE